MSTVPVVPVFPAGSVAGSAALTQAGAAAEWLSWSAPITQLGQTAAQSIPNTTATAMQWAPAIVDRDSGLTSATTYTAQTPGFYALQASVTYAANATGIRQCWFTVTTGSNNPAGPGITTSFALASGASAGSGTASAAASKMTVPQRVYAGDYFQVMAFQSSGGALLTSLSPAASSWTIRMVSA